jgi:hypothetical protein
MSAASVDERSAEAAVRALGVRCVVEARGNLAVLIPSPDDRSLDDPEHRRRVLAALRERGFTHAAVELT